VALDAEMAEERGTWNYSILQGSFDALEPESNPICSSDRADWPVSDENLFDAVKLGEHELRELLHSRTGDFPFGLFSLISL
jgi:hypothetical protein